MEWKSKMERRAKGLHESKMGTEYIHFHKATDDRSMGLFFKCGGGEGGMVTLWWGKEDKSLEFRLPQSKNQMPISTQEILASSLQLYLLVAGRSSALFCAFYILYGHAVPEF